jgi:hypothetical protein
MRERKREIKMKYVIARISDYECFNVKGKYIHIYARKSGDKEKLRYYYNEIKNRYPCDKVVVTTEEKAIEVQEQYRKHYAELERISLGCAPRIDVKDLDKALDRSYTKQLAVEACGRR